MCICENCLLNACSLGNRAKRRTVAKTIWNYDTKVVCLEESKLFDPFVEVLAEIVPNRSFSFIVKNIQGILEDPDWE